MAYLPDGGRRAGRGRGAASSEIAAEEGLRVLGLAGRARRRPTSWAAPPASACRSSASSSSRPRRGARRLELDRARLLPAQARRARGRGLLPVASARTVVYKGMLTTGQLEPFFPDLSDERFATELALVALALLDQHLPVAGRWRTPTGSSPTTARSTPSRATATGCAPARASSRSDVIPGDLERIFPICTPGASDSATFDEVLELLHLGGRSLPHAVLMMIPEAWENHESMDPARKAFYEFHSTFMEPWDGPACVDLHRRHAHRRGARPQRPAPGPLLGHRRRARRARLRGRRPRPRAGERRAARAPPARPDVPRRHRRRPDRQRRGDQVLARRREALRGVAARRPHPACRPARARAHHPHGGLGAPVASAPSATPRRS